MYKALALLAAVVVCVNGAGYDPANFWATLTPTSPATTGNGLCHFRYDKTTLTLTTHCQHDVASPTAAHIHIAPDAQPTSTGGPIVVFDGTGASPIKKTSVLTPAQEQALFSGFLYVNVHTTAQPGGQCRGNIMKNGDAMTYVAELDNMQEVPPVTPTTASSGIAMVKKLAAAGKYDVSVYHTIAAVTAAHVHAGTYGVVGNNTGAAIVLCTSAATCLSSPIIKTNVDELDAMTWSWITSGRAYVNLHTAAHTGGEARGQLTAIATQELPPMTNANWAANFWADLTKYNGATTGMGVCHFRYNTTTMVLWYHCQHDILSTEATAAHIHIGAAGQNGDPIATLSATGASPFRDKTAPLTNDQEEKLFTEGLYVNVHSKTFAGGQIRGQITSAVPAGTWVAEIDNYQELTAPATLSWGLGVVKRVGTAAPFTYTVTLFHTLGAGKLNSAHIHGPITNNMDRSTAPAIVVICTGSGATACGDSPTMKADLAESAVTVYENIRDGKTYLNLHTTAYPGGEIRGHVLKVEALTQPMRPKNAASALSVSVSVFAALVLAIFALLQ